MWGWCLCREFAVTVGPAANFACFLVLGFGGFGFGWMGFGFGFVWWVYFLVLVDLVDLVVLA